MKIRTNPTFTPAKLLYLIDAEVMMSLHSRHGGTRLLLLLLFLLLLVLFSCRRWLAKHSSLVRKLLSLPLQLKKTKLPHFFPPSLLPPPPLFPLCSHHQEACIDIDSLSACTETNQSMSESKPIQLSTRRVQFSKDNYIQNKCKLD